MAKVVNAADMVAAYQRGMSGGSANYKRGVQSVTENPAQAAQARVDDGTWARNTAAAQTRLSAALGRVTLQGWKDSAATNGATAFAASAAKAGPKFAARAAQLAQAATNASAAAKNETDPIAKVRASINAMKQGFGKEPI